MTTKVVAEPVSSGGKLTLLKSQIRVEDTYGYSEGLVALKIGDKVLIFPTNYIEGKHGEDSSSAGSKLREMDSVIKLTEFLRDNVNEDILANINSVVRLANIASSYTVGTDTLVEISSLSKGGKPVSLSLPLQTDTDYDAVVKDAAGNEHIVILRYEITRPGSEDGKFPPTLQPVAYTNDQPPETSKLNIVIGAIDLNDERAKWSEPEKLKAALGKQFDDIEGVYAVFTIFPGTYAPAVNEQMDTVLNVHGSDFWRTHALMKTL
ncbi:hypothetical protein M1590_02405 [Candidatus Marsarchaeota archaeon]|nr:hypothetical protein [Candidatus Marsarchaeota archaeon]